MHEDVHDFYRDIKKYAPLTRAQELDLAHRAYRGDTAARNKIVVHNLRFVIKIATGYQGRGLGIRDLVGHGRIGAIAAAERFNPALELKFISYAVWWIRQAIIKGLLEHGGTIRQVAVVFDDTRKVEKARRRLEQELHRQPTQAELIETSGITREHFEHVKTNSEGLVWIDTPLDSDSPRDTLLDANDLGGWEPTEAAISAGTTHDTLDQFLGRLNAQERQVIRRWFGIDGKGGEVTLLELGEEMGLTRERVRQIKEKALKKLQHPGAQKELKTLINGAS